MLCQIWWIGRNWIDLLQLVSVGFKGILNKQYLNFKDIEFGLLWAREDVMLYRYGEIFLRCEWIGWCSRRHILRIFIKIRKIFLINFLFLVFFLFCLVTLGCWGFGRCVWVEPFRDSWEVDRRRERLRDHLCHGLSRCLICWLWSLSGACLSLIVEAIGVVEIVDGGCGADAAVGCQDRCRSLWDLERRWGECSRVPLLRKSLSSFIIFFFLFKLIWCCFFFV